jgi:hypothetical protein
MSPQINRFVEHLIRFLMPYFLDAAPSIEEARAEILETLASYGARTRQEFLLAAQIIAFGLSTLDILADAKSVEMSPSMRLRYRGCANSLGRASQQTEKALAKLLTCDLPGANKPAPEEALNDISEQDLREALRQAKATLDSTRHRLSNPAPTTQAQKGNGMFDPLFEAARSSRPAAG